MQYIKFFIATQRQLAPILAKRVLGRTQFPAKPGESVEILQNIFRVCCKESANFFSFSCSTSMSRYWDERALFSLLWKWYKKGTSWRVQFDGADSLTTLIKISPLLRLNCSKAKTGYHGNIEAILHFNSVWSGTDVHHSHSWSWMKNVKRN